VVVERKPITLPEYITVAELASRLEISANDIIKTLMKQGLMVSVNQTLTFDRASQIASAFGFDAASAPAEEPFVEEPDDPSTLVARPPVITVLGHVDHGKTSLLDAIRKTNVTAGEAGGITQRIGAYQVDHNSRRITFLDTPGHEAFTAMRARGAQVTDVAVLVVAADDGVKPQTIEALNHARAAKVPIVVAINKVDKPGANIDKVKQQLADLQLLSEEWGGQTVMVPVSAKQNQGIDELLDMILLVADLQELKANPHKHGIGTIIEAKLDKGLGPVATVLVQNGTLMLGDAVVVGNVVGKVRALINDHGERVRKAPPSTPVEIIGLETVPQAGDLLHVVDDEKLSRQIVTDRLIKDRETRMQAVSRTSLDDLFRQMKEGEVKDLNIIIKADGQGSVEALKHSLTRLSNAEVRVNVIHGGVGTITESDIMLATTSNSMIIGFNVRPDPTIKRLADQESIDIRLYRVIYHVIDEIKAAMTGMLEPEFEETMLGRADVRQIFKVTGVGIIAGCMVTDGKIIRESDVRVLRDGVVVYEGKIDSVRRFKDDVKEVAAGYECGIGVSKFPGIQQGDVIEAYQLKEIARKEIAPEQPATR
jgi:translation initiation factor IF-2